MANNKKTTSAPAKTTGKAATPAPERDPYAYYDDLYKKKPRKKKSSNEKLPEEDYEKYDEIFMNCRIRYHRSGDPHSGNAPCL